MSDSTNGRATWFDYLLIWVWMFGVWPLADPGHHADTLMSVLDIVLHVAAIIILMARWRVKFSRRF